MAKPKKPQDLIPTKELRPVDPYVHRAEVHYIVKVIKGTVERVLVCECGQRVKLGEEVVAGFHTVKPND